MVLIQHNWNKSLLQIFMIVPKFRRLLLFMLSWASECGGVFTRYLLSNLATNAVLQSPAAAVLQTQPSPPVGWVSGLEPGMQFKCVSRPANHVAPATMYTTGKKCLQWLAKTSAL